MFRLLLKQEWLRINRSLSYKKEAAERFAVAFIMVIFGFYIFGLSFYLPHALRSLSEEPFELFNSFIIYYFLSEFALRYFFQSLPVINIQPLLHLPVRKGLIVRFLLLKSIVSPINLLVPIFFAPFIFTTVIEIEGFSYAVVYFLSLWAWSFVIHFFTLLFKKELDDNPVGIAIFILLVMLIAGSQIYGWYSLGEITAPFFLLPQLSLVAALVFTFVSYSICQVFLLKHTYIDDWIKQEKSAGKVEAFGFLHNYGLGDSIVQQEIRLIFRHKRTRNALILSVIFTLYGLWFYLDQRYVNSNAFLIFVGIFTSGMFIINYGQYLYSWNNESFDFYLTSPISLYAYLKSKFLLLSTSVLLLSLITIPYVYFGWKVLFINISMAFFNLGVNGFIIMNMAMCSPNKINLSKGNMLNYEGVGIAQWVMGIPIMATPYVIYIPFKLYGLPEIGILSIGLVGLMGIIFHDSIIKFTAKRLLEKKYSISASFRSN